MFCFIGCVRLEWHPTVPRGGALLASLPHVLNAPTTFVIVSVCAKDEITSFPIIGAQFPFCVLLIRRHYSWLNVCLSVYGRPSRLLAFKMATDPISDFLSVVARIYLFTQICEPFLANSTMNTINNMSDTPL
jgi:hypothetical protein